MASCVDSRRRAVSWCILGRVGLAVAAGWEIGAAGVTGGATRTLSAADKAGEAAAQEAARRRGSEGPPGVLVGEDLRKVRKAGTERPGSGRFFTTLA
ncbi:hypothetical protein MRX96_000793 [Rhipicephalus microplus]